MNHIGIDVYARDKAKMLRALRQLKTVESAEDGGVYHMGPECSQVHVVTSMTEKQIDAWCYNTKAGDGYLGTFTMKELA